MNARKSNAWFSDTPHRRFSPLTGEWVLVSPHRTQRPWQGGVETLPRYDRPRYDPKCYLCPGNERAGGVKNPAYEHTFVFDNDFAALLPLSGAADTGDPGKSLLRAEAVGGTCRVICFSPRHDLTLSEMEPPDIRRVVDTWAEQYTELAAAYRWVQIFENRGALMGYWQLHAHFYPPLLRSATVRKFLVGYEMLAEVQRDITAEQAAERLRACSTRRFRSK